MSERDQHGLDLVGAIALMFFDANTPCAPPDHARAVIARVRAHDGLALMAIKDAIEGGDEPGAPRIIRTALRQGVA